LLSSYQQQKAQTFQEHHDEESSKLPHETISLVNLPLEILNQIFCEVKWDSPTVPFELDGLQFYENLTANESYIASIRLTCRRLASAAAPWLMLAPCVSLTDPESIDHLEQIAANTSFSPYVKAVRVSAGFYSEKIAQDIRNSAKYLIWNVEGIKRVLEDLGYQDVFSTRLPGNRTPEKWDKILDEWKALSNNGDEQDQRGGKSEPSSASVDRDSEAMQLLEKEHTEYQRRFNKQQKLLMAGPESAVERIAGAIAKMPQATRLVLSDASRCADYSIPKIPSEGGDGWLLSPMSWASYFKLHYSLGDHPARIFDTILNTLFNLPIAIHRAGINLTALRIRNLRLLECLPL
jgi:hypothetical protein